MDLWSCKFWDLTICSIDLHVFRLNILFITKITTQRFSVTKTSDTPDNIHCINESLFISVLVVKPITIKVSTFPSNLTAFPWIRWQNVIYSSNQLYLRVVRPITVSIYWPEGHKYPTASIGRRPFWQDRCGITSSPVSLSSLAMCDSIDPITMSGSAIITTHYLKDSLSSCPHLHGKEIGEVPRTI